MSESYLIGVILSVVGGYFDAYTYIARDHVFANAQTGNIVLLGINLASGEIQTALRYLPPVLAFLLGIFLAEVIRKTEHRTKLHWRQSVLLLELAAIVLVTFLPSGRISGVNYNLISNIIISFVCSLQVQSFRKIRGITCATTMCTGNLRSAAEGMMTYINNKDREQLHSAGKYFGIVGFFILGAAVSTVVTGIFGTYAVAFASAGLIICILLMFKKSD